MSRDPWRKYARIRANYEEALDEIDRCDWVSWWLGVALAVAVAVGVLIVVSAVA